MGRRRAWLLGGVVLGGLAPGPVSCAPPRVEVPALELLSFRQAGHSGVGLNETLFFHFSEALDRVSVTGETVRILDASGRPVSGELSVNEANVTFTPRLPLSHDLTDGGFRPNQLLRVELAGFPRPDGLRAQRSEAPLARSLRFTFRTASGEAGEPFFLDDFPERPGFLSIPAGGAVIGPDDPIYVECGEPIHPASLTQDDFQLEPYEIEATAVEPRIPLEVRLVENDRHGARIELRPTRGGFEPFPLLTPGDYRLGKQGTVTNLAGRPIAAVWEAFPRPVASIRVKSVRRESRWIDFQSDSQLWFGEPPGVDGTAAWPLPGGGVGVRYPRAAGDGRAGTVSLQAAPSEHDLQATYLEVPLGAEVDLGDEPGLRVLRAQNALTVNGKLVRGASTQDSSRLLDEQVARRRFQGEERPALSEWLEEIRASGETWTVLVSGGDLRVSGTIEVAGPLMLVAGGWIRIYGRVEADEIWKTPEGGQNARALRSGLHDLPFELEPPVENPLVAPLTLAALSVAIRPGGVQEWRPFRAEGEPGSGSFHVRLLGLRDVGEQSREYGPTESVELLRDCPAVRLVFFLRVPPGPGPWDPPRIDRVELAWIESPP